MSETAKKAAGNILGDKGTTIAGAVIAALLVIQNSEDLTAWQTWVLPAAVAFLTAISRVK